MFQGNLTKWQEKVFKTNNLNCAKITIGTLKHISTIRYDGYSIFGVT